MRRVLAFVVLAVSLVISTEAAADVEPLEVNRDQLVEMAVVGEIAPPRLGNPPFRVGPFGEVGLYPGTGSITYNFRTGDSAVDIAADHVEPAVSIYNPGPENSRTSRESTALNALSCIGNLATVITGDAKGAQGWVIGKHGGAEHVMVDFPDEVYDHLVVGDEIQVRSVGAGMKMLNLDGVHIRNMSPSLLDALTERGMGVADGRLHIAVTHRVPAKIMGSGLGRNHVFTGDYDIQLFDPVVIEEYGLDTLRFGDIVAIMDAETSYGRIHYTGAITVGVVVHSYSATAGHGPGVTTLFSSKEGKIELTIDAAANLGTILGFR